MLSPVRVATLLLVCLVGMPAQGWWDCGHKIIASIAFRRLTPSQQTTLVEILRQHPRFEQDFRSKMPADVPPELEGEWIVQQCSVWPDLARDFKGADRDKYHRGPWHYQDIPLFLTDADRAAMEKKLTLNMESKVPSVVANPNDLNALQAIALAQATALDSNSPAADRAVAFCWLFHVIGDIHQPCHSTAMFSQKLFPNLGEGDRGGNLVKVTQRGNLHSLWDSFLGSRGQVVEMKNRAVAMMADPELSAVGEAAIQKLTSTDWQVESFELAKEYVYDAEILAFLRALESSGAPADSMACTVTEDYLKRGGKVSERRVVEAGYRIGAILGDSKNEPRRGRYAVTGRSAVGRTRLRCSSAWRNMSRLACSCDNRPKTGCGCVGGSRFRRSSDVRRCSSAAVSSASAPGSSRTAVLGTRMPRGIPFFRNRQSAIRPTNVRTNQLTWKSKPS